MNGPRGDKLRKPIDSATLQNPYPLEALLRPIALRFKYHFDSTRQTNKLDKVLHLHLPRTIID